MRVPVYVSMVIMLLYIVLGAVLFSMWEDWEMSEAAYFCFITLATIGFGDFVPGQCVCVCVCVRGGGQCLCLCVCVCVCVCV